MCEAKRKSKSLPAGTDGDEEDEVVVVVVVVGWSDDESISPEVLLPVPRIFEIPSRKRVAQAIFLEACTKRHGGESCRSTAPKTAEAAARASRTTVETGAKATRMVWGCRGAIVCSRKLVFSSSKLVREMKNEGSKFEAQLRAAAAGKGWRWRYCAQATAPPVPSLGNTCVALVWRLRHRASHFGGL